jgi:signal transduction histidine kinase
LLSLLAEGREIGRNANALFQSAWPRALSDEKNRQDDQRRRSMSWLFVALGTGLLSAGLFLTAQRRDQVRLREQETALVQVQSASSAADSELFARTQSERRMAVELALLSLENRSLVDSIRSSLLLGDNALRVRQANVAARRRFGFGDVVGRTLGEVAELAALVAALGGEAVMLESLSKGVPLQLPELRVDAGGQTFWLFLTFTPYLDEAGKTRGFILIADDISPLISARERLMQTERLAAMGRISAQVTHEVRNPLSALALNADLLSDEIDAMATGGGSAPEAKTLLAAITREVERLTAVTEEYLGLARLKAPTLTRESLNQLVSELNTFLGEEFRARQIASRLVLHEPDPQVLVDAGQLRQALLNVLKNAVEAMPNGGELTIATVLRGGRAEIDVRDRGGGIPGHVQARIFDPFYTTKNGGTGLGLPITQQIVAEHGGEVSCVSVPGEGTTITVSLPAA